MNHYRGSWYVQGVAAQIVRLFTKNQRNSLLQYVCDWIYENRKSHIEIIDFEDFKAL